MDIKDYLGIPHQDVGGDHDCVGFVIHILEEETDFECELRIPIARWKRGEPLGKVMQDYGFRKVGKQEDKELFDIAFFDDGEEIKHSGMFVDKRRVLHCPDDSESICHPVSYMEEDVTSTWRPKVNKNTNQKT